MLKNTLFGCFASLMIMQATFAQNNLILDVPIASSITENKTAVIATLTPTGNITYTKDRYGVEGSAVVFDGASHFTITSDTILKNLSSYSVSVWVKPAVNDGINQYIFSKVTPNRDIALGLNNGTFNTHFTNNTNTYFWLDDVEKYVAGVWVHLVSVYDGTTLKLYKNGTLAKTITPASQPSWTSANIYFGTLASYHFNGAADELKVYGRALSSTEIEEMQDDLILSMPFTNTAVDVSKFNNTVTTTGTPTYVAGRNGEANEAVKLNGSSYFKISPYTNFTVASYTVEAWIKPAVANAANQYVFSKDSPQRDIVLGLNNGQFNTHFTNASTQYTWVEDPAKYNKDEWYHVACVYTTDSLKLYKNGVLVKASKTTSSPSLQATNVYVGSLAGSYSFNGAIDDIKVYKKARTKDEIAIAAENVQDDLILSMPFTNSAVDVSNLNNTVTTTGTPTYVAGRNGEANDAVMLNGSSYFKISPYTNFTVSSYTVEAWIKPAVANAVNQYVFSKDSPQRDIVLGLNNGQFNTHFTNASTQYTWVEDPAKYNKDEWYHVACVYTTDSLKLYKNGILVKASKTTSSPSLQATNVYVGSLAGSYSFNGAIDEIKVYKKALSKQEIATNAQNTITSVSENMSSTSISIFPNPAKELLNVINLEEDAVLKIFSMQGTLVFQETINTNSQVNIKSLAKGIYVSTITKGDATLSTTKLIVE